MALDEEPEPIRSTDPTSGESSFAHRIREGQPKPLEGSSVAFFRRAEHDIARQHGDTGDADFSAAVPDRSFRALL